MKEDNGVRSKFIDYDGIAASVLFVLLFPLCLLADVIERMR